MAVKTVKANKRTFDFRFDYTQGVYYWKQNRSFPSCKFTEVSAACRFLDLSKNNFVNIPLFLWKFDRIDRKQCTIMIWIFWVHWARCSKLNVGCFYIKRIISFNCSIEILNLKIVTFHWIQVKIYSYIFLFSYCQLWLHYDKIEQTENEVISRLLWTYFYAQCAQEFRSRE